MKESFNGALDTINELLGDVDELIGQNRDLQTLVLDMSAYLTKLVLLHDDAGIATVNKMFLDRFREIIGVRRTDGIDMSKTIAGDV